MFLQCPRVICDIDRPSELRVRSTVKPLFSGHSIQRIPLYCGEPEPYVEVGEDAYVTHKTR